MAVAWSSFLDYWMFFVKMSNKYGDSLPSLFIGHGALVISVKYYMSVV